MKPLSYSSPGISVETNSETGLGRRGFLRLSTATAASLILEACGGGGSGEGDGINASQAVTSILPTGSSVASNTTEVAPAATPTAEVPDEKPTFSALKITVNGNNVRIDDAGIKDTNGVGSYEYFARDAVTKEVIAKNTDGNFAGLPDGKYTFSASALTRKGANGVWERVDNPNTVDVTIDVVPPTFQSDTFVNDKDGTPNIISFSRSRGTVTLNEAISSTGKRIDARLMSFNEGGKAELVLPLPIAIGPNGTNILDVNFFINRDISGFRGGQAWIEFEVTGPGDTPVTIRTSTRYIL